MLVSSSTSVDTSKYDTSNMDVDNDHGTLTQEDFLNLFVKQMQNQDPTEPMDSSEMMQQTATFTQIQSMTSMSDNIESMVDSMTNMTNQVQMSSATSVIGMVMEYNGNNTTLTDNGAAIEFQMDAIPATCSVVIKDSDGNFVRSLSPTVTDTGKQYLVWDGKDASGNAMDTGSYSFAVSAKDADGESIDVNTYGNGQVTGVTIDDGAVVYEVDGSFDVAAEDVVSVRDADLF